LYKIRNRETGKFYRGTEVYYYPSRIAKEKWGPKGRTWQTLNGCESALNYWHTFAKGNPYKGWDLDELLAMHPEIEIVKYSAATLDIPPVV